MLTSAQATLREILTQTLAWEEALKIVHGHQAELEKFDIQRYAQVIFIGCGSTHYLSMSAAAVMQTLSGVICRGIPSSEIVLTPENILTDNKRKSLLVAVSRSGTTTETLRGVEKFREGDYGDVITITNYGNSELARMGGSEFGDRKRPRREHRADQIVRLDVCSS